MNLFYLVCLKDKGENTLSIGKKLSISFYTFIALFCISVVVSFINFNNIENQANKNINNRIIQIQLIDELRYATAMQSLYLTELEDSTEVEGQLSSYLVYLQEQIKELDKNVKNDETAKDLLQQVKEKVAFYEENLEKAISLLKSGKTNEGKKLVNDVLIVANKDVTSLSNEMLAHENREIGKNLTDSQKQIQTSKITSIVVLIISLVVSFIFIYFIRRTITLPLQTVVKSVREISLGDLTKEDLKVKAKDEIGELSESFNLMKNNLRSLISNVHINSEQLTKVADHLTASTQEMSSMTEDITERVMQTSNSVNHNAKNAAESAQGMEDTAKGVYEIAESTQILYSTSKEASDMAIHGEEIVRHAEKQMGYIHDATASVNDLVQKLSEQTEEIETISKVITEITEQTNLLALNAAIEAARAGEHGKGFAVVAEEVRKLAEQSNGSASKIVELTKEIMHDTKDVEKAVENSLHYVKDGVNVIEQAGDAFTNIVKAVEKMSNQIQGISKTSEQISANAEEVSASVNEISINSTNSAKEVEFIAATIEQQAETMLEVNKVAEQLNEKAKSLQAEIEKFDV